MSVWKSPVFYFGVVLALLVFFALLAPFIVNWNAWKPELEAYGRRLTGREVVIAGSVDVRLFPWPRLTAYNVVLANEEDFGDAPLLAADSMTTRFSLAGLFNGNLQVEEIEFDAPQLNLVRNAAGRMNWRLVPDRALDGLLSRVKLDRISIHNGGIWFEDKFREQSHSVTSINARLSAQALEGPWRLNGRGNWRDTAMSLSLSTGAYKAGDGLRLALTATPVDVELPIFSLDGHWKEEQMAGNLRLSGQEASDGKGSIQDKLRPLALQAAYTLTPASVRFEKIRIAPVDKRDGGTLIEGNAAIDFVPEARAKLALKSPRIDLDVVLGAGSQARLRRGGILAVANSIFAELPAKAHGEFTLDVNVLTANGETLNDVNIKGTAEQQAIRIHNASANLPGRTRAKFDGVIFPASGSSDLGGSLALESNDLRTFTGWMLPQFKEDIARYWTGARGRLKLQGNINWSAQRLALQELDYELDGLPGKGRATLVFGEVPQVLLSVDAKALNLDTYVAGKRKEQGAWSLGQAVSLLPVALDLGQSAEHRMLLSADSLTFNGVSAAGIDVDYSAGLSGLEIKALNFTSPGGASVTSQGLIINGAEGPVGEIEIGMKADDVKDVLQLAGVAQAAPVRALSSLFGNTDAKLSLAIEPDGGKPLVKIKGNAKSGALTASSDGVFTNLDGKHGPGFKGVIDIDVADARTIADVLLQMPVALGPAAVRMELDGGGEAGFAANLTAKLLQTGLSYKGKLAPNAAFWGLDGVAAVEASSLKAWFDAAAIPVSLATDMPLTWQGLISSKDGALSISQGEQANGSVALNANISADKVISADIETGPIDLKQLFAVALLPWRGAEVDLASGFAAPQGMLFHGDVFLRPSQLRTGIGAPLREAVVGIAVHKDGRAFNVKTPGKNLDVDIAVVQKGSSFELAGNGRIAVELAKVTAGAGATPAVSGQIIMDGQFAGMGRSPAAVLQAMEGKGTFWLEGATMNTIAASGFGMALAAVSSPDDLTRLLDDVSRSPGTALPAQTGPVVVTGGFGTTAPLTVQSKFESLVVEPALDLTSGELTIKSLLQAKQRPDLPPVTYTYSGMPGALNLRKGSAALAAKLGYELMSAEMARLEKLQQEEQEILQREEEQRQADQQRYDAFQAQRGELRQRMRELRFHQEERKRLEAVRAQDLSNALREGDAINRAELEKRLRELAIRRELAEPVVQP